MNKILFRGKFIISKAFQRESIRGFTLQYTFLNNGGVCGKLYQVTPVRSCTVQTQPPDTDEDPPLPKRKMKDRDKVDWLPFEWYWRPRTNNFIRSGDLVQTLEYDPSWPKPDFELSEELKTASDDVKYIFSLATASKAEIKEVIKRNILKKVQRHPNDMDSLEVQIALKTIQVRSLFDHSREVKKDIRGSRIVLHNLILKRNRLLKTLYRIDSERFEWLTKELKLKYRPQQLGGRLDMYCRKWDLRRLTKEYCGNTIKAKKATYHEELKKQQAEFLKEKEEILAWIEKEEKELANLTI